MPGRVLVIDPIVTNRIMLKAQLSMDFFTVSLASDLAEMQSALRTEKPDVILLSYHADVAQDFEMARWLKGNAASSYIPLIFLKNTDDASIWDQTHDLMVDDVIAYRAPNWQMKARLNLLIRAKENLDAVMARHQTMSDMGFAEPAIAFPPALPMAAHIDMTSCADRFGAPLLDQLKSHLLKDFPNVVLETQADTTKTSPPADVTVIDPYNMGTDAAFAKMVHLRRTHYTFPPAILYLAPSKTEAAAQHAIEFGASDFCLSLPSPRQLACKLRRILWQSQLARSAEKTVSLHLQSALIDPLTGVYNRRYALQHLEQILRTDAGANHTVTAMVLDLDRFKSINDTYGHLTGDAVIQQTAERLKQNLRPADLVARLGGEEFLIVLKDASVSRVRTIAERLRREISATPFQTEDGVSVSVSASIGVSATLANWPCAKAAIDSADVALYRSKDNGRDRVTYNDCAA